MTRLHTVAIAVGVIGAALVIAGAGYRWGQRSRDSDLTGLSQRLAESERTVELKQGLYATALTQVSDVRRLLDSRDAEQAGLLRQLDAAKAQVLTTERVVVKWKQPYSSPTEAVQTPGPLPDRPGEERRRVDFRHDFGPFLVSGYTLTNPAAGFVTVSQGRPIVLTVTVARGGDGKWSSYVTSSEPGVGIEVTLGAVDPGILAPRWYQRLWVTAGTGLFGGTSVSLGAEYRGERYSAGPQCTVWSGGHACGASFGVRLFD